MSFLNQLSSTLLDRIVLLLPVLAVFFVPVTVYRTVIPYIFRPDVFGGVPWFDPHPFTVNVFYLFFVCVCVYMIALVSCVIASLQRCKKYAWSTSARYATHVVAWTIAGLALINTVLLPYGKAPLLSMLRLPYNVYFVDGLMLMPFVYLGVIIATGHTLPVVCKK